jgi:hypothetical protein
MVDILPILPSLSGYVGRHSMFYQPRGGLCEGDTRVDRAGLGPRVDITTRHISGVWESMHWVFVDQNFVSKVALKMIWDDYLPLTSIKF